MDKDLKKRFLKACNQRIPDVMPQKDYREHIQGVNGIDKMSPYSLPSSDKYYNTIVEAMNRKGFPAKYPQSYTPIAGYFRKFNVTPFFNPEDRDGWSKGMLTVAGMVELHSMNQPFQILRDQDFDTIITIAETYHKSASKFNDTNVQAYLRKVDGFLKEINNARRRMLRRTNQVDTKMSFVDILQKILGIPA